MPRAKPRNMTFQIMTVSFQLILKRKPRLEKELLDSAKDYLSKKKSEFPQFEEAQLQKDNASIMGKEAFIGVVGGEGHGFNVFVGWRGKTEDNLLRLDAFLNGLFALSNTKMETERSKEVGMDFVMSLTMPVRSFPVKEFINESTLARLNERTKINFSPGGLILRSDLEEWEYSVALSLAPKGIRTQLIYHKHFKQGFPFDYCQKIYKQAWGIAESLKS